MDAVEMMAYAGQVPWHGKGTFSDKPMISEEAIKLAGLDWEVGIGPVFAGKDPETAYVLPNKRCTVRLSDNSVLGIVGPEYSPIQNSEVFSFLDSLVQDGVLRYETAGSLFNGAWVWMLARMEEDMIVGDDVYRRYLLGLTSHDGSSSLKAFPTDVRVVCNNTLRMAISARKTGPIGIVGHSGDIKAKMEAAQKVLAVSNEAQRNLKAYLETLAAAKMTEAQVNTVASKLFKVEIGKGGSLDEETPAVKAAAVARFLNIYNAEKERQGETGYSVFQAITGYADHGSIVRQDTVTQVQEVTKEVDGKQVTVQEEVEVKVDKADSRMKRFMGKANDFKREGSTILNAVCKIKAPEVVLA